MNTLKLFGQEITIYSKIFNTEDFIDANNTREMVQEFIEEAESSASSMPVLGMFDSELKKISSENSQLKNSDNDVIEYKVKNIGDLFEPPQEGKILLVYYYLYLSSEYEIEILDETAEFSYDVNNFNNLAILSENNKHIDFQNNSADDSTDTYIKAFFNDGAAFESIQDEQEQLISDLENYLSA